MALQTMSYRSSLHPGAFNSSAASSASSSSPSPAATLLMEKQREYTAFAQVCAHAEHLAHFLDSFADKYEVLDGGSEGASLSSPRDASGVCGRADSFVLNLQPWETSSSTGKTSFASRAWHWVRSRPRATFAASR